MISASMSLMVAGGTSNCYCSKTGEVAFCAILTLVFGGDSLCTVLTIFGVELW